MVSLVSPVENIYNINKSITKLVVPVKKKKRKIGTGLVSEFNTQLMKYKI